MPAEPPVFPCTDAVAVKAHRHPSVGVPGVYEVAGQVEVAAHNLRKGVVGFLVGVVRTPVGQSRHLPVRERIGQERGVMSLHQQLVVAAVHDDMGLHPVAQQDVTQFGLQVRSSGVGVLSDGHNRNLSGVMRRRFPRRFPVVRLYDGRIVPRSRRWPGGSACRNRRRIPPATRGCGGSHSPASRIRRPASFR